jgi:DNA polymerase (family 10)
MRRDMAMGLAAPLVSALRGLGGRVEVCGPLRRGAELVDRVVVVTTAPVAALAVPARVELVWSSDGRFGRDVVIATGSDAHVEALRARARGRGLDFDTLAGDDEDAVYAGLGLLQTPPELREQGVLIEQGQARPRLVRREDLRGALHNHTTASDGADDLPTMVQAAAAAGLEWFGVSDHSVAAAYAHGLDGPRLAAQRDEIRALPSSSVVVLSGVESDILKDGQLDLKDDVLAAGEVVVASMHQRYGLSGAPLTERLVRAARHPLVDVVGHPTGRLLLSRAPADFDVLALLDACAASGCAVELNANPARLDFGERWLREAQARGVLVSIAADAHAREELANLEHGVAVARRAGLSPDDVLNTRDVEGLRAWLRGRRVRAGVVAGGAP